MSTLHSFNTLRLEYINYILKENQLSIKNSDCLDVGCGGGLLSESLRRLGGNILGIDPNPTSFEIANNHLNVYQGKEKEIMK